MLIDLRKLLSGTEDDTYSISACLDMDNVPMTAFEQL